MRGYGPPARQCRPLHRESFMSYEILNEGKRNIGELLFFEQLIIIIIIMIHIYTG